MSAYDLRKTRQLLVLIAAAARAARSGKGVSLARARALTGLRSDNAVRELVAETDGLWTDPAEGEPPLSLYVEDDEVLVTYPQHFGHVAALSVAEGAMIASALEPYRETGGKPVKDALAKIRKAIPEPLRPAADQMVNALELVATDAGPWAGTLRKAIAERRAVLLQYRSVADGSVAPRTVEPRLLFHRDACWYLAAWNPEKGAEHLFRLDRIATAELTDRVFGEHKGPPVARYGRRQLFFASGTEREVTLRFRGAAARDAKLRYGARARDAGGGAVTVTTRVTPGNYLYGVVLGRGGELELEGPADVAAGLRARIEELQRLYA